MQVLIEFVMTTCYIVFDWRDRPNKQMFQTNVTSDYLLHWRSRTSMMVFIHFAENDPLHVVSMIWPLAVSVWNSAVALPFFFI